MKSVVVTGVSSGIGRAVAEECAGAGYRVYGSVRRARDADALATALGERFVPLVFDVTDGDAVRAAAARVERDLAPGGVLGGLVNNAGASAGAGPLMHSPLADVRLQLELNVIGLLAVTQAFLPLLGARRPRPATVGRIVNISSVGGRLAAPFIGAYAASKHAVEGLSDALRRELMLYGIDVIVIQPGAIQTAIWDKAAALDVSVFDDTDYAPILGRFRDEFVRRGQAGLPATRVASVVRTALETARPRDRYAIVPQRLVNWTLPRLLPTRWVDRLIAAAVGLTAAQQRLTTEAAASPEAR